MKNINELSIVELKVLCFDLDQEIKFKQTQYNQVMTLLQEKLQQEEKSKEKIDKDIKK